MQQILSLCFIHIGTFFSGLGSVCFSLQLIFLMEMEYSGTGRSAFESANTLC